MNAIEPYMLKVYQKLAGMSTPEQLGPGKVLTLMAKADLQILADLPKDYLQRLVPTNFDRLSTDPHLSVARAFAVLALKSQGKNLEVFAACLHPGQDDDHPEIILELPSSDGTKSARFHAEIAPPFFKKRLNGQLFTENVNLNNLQESSLAIIGSICMSLNMPKRFFILA